LTSFLKRTTQATALHLIENYVCYNEDVASKNVSIEMDDLQEFDVF